MNRANSRTVSSSLCAWLALAILAVAVNAAFAWQEAGDKFDGAIWNFTMRPKQPRLETLKGHFRVFNHVLYQKETPEDPDFTKVVGKNNPRGSRTLVDFTDLRAFDKNRKVHAGIRGQARLAFDDAGEWSGVLTDKEGRNWDFKCSRIQE